MQEPLRHLWSVNLALFEALIYPVLVLEFGPFLLHLAAEVVLCLNQ